MFLSILVPEFHLQEFGDIVVAERTGTVGEVKDTITGTTPRAMTFVHINTIFNAGFIVGKREIGRYMVHVLVGLDTVRTEREIFFFIGFNVISLNSKNFHVIQGVGQK